MKRLLLLALVLGLTSTANAQVPRKVLIEKFTNTGCGPCAVSDPMFEEFEAKNLSRITVIKYHTQGPDPSDPYYISQSATKESNNRSSYYKITGVPTMMYSGFTGTNPSVGAAAMEKKLNTAINATPTSAYQMSLTQSIEGDSVIALVTVKVVSAPPTATDLRLAVVFTERFNEFTGNNGTPFHTDIARKVVPGLTTAGEVKVDANYPAFSQAEGETKTYRYAAKIGETWDVSQLVSVAFIQAAKAKTIYQTEWTMPAVSLPGGLATVQAGTVETPITFENKGTEPMVVNVEFTSTATPGWSVTLEGLAQDNTFTVAPNSSGSLKLKTVSTGKGSARYEISIPTIGGVYVGDAKGALFGADNDIAIVNGSSDADYGYGLATTLFNIQRPAGVMSRADFYGTMTTWEKFKTVIYTAEQNVGIQIGTGEWENAAEFVNGGGNFAFMGSNMVAIYAGSNNETYMDNIRDIFGVDPTSQYDDDWFTVKGVAGDVVGDGVNAELVASIIRHNLEPINGSVVAFKNEQGDNVGIRHLVGQGKTALMTFDPDNLDAANKSLVTDRLMDWFESANASVKISDNATTTELSNYPNPFNPSTTIEFSITEPAPVTLIVKDMMGRDVATLIDFQMHERGTYSQKFDATDLASGTYMYELTAGSQKITKKMTLNK